MEIIFDVFTHPYEITTRIGNFILKNYPVGSDYHSIDNGNYLYLKNILKVKTTDTKFNGDYYIEKTVITPQHNLIEIRLKRIHGGIGTDLYLRGQNRNQKDYIVCDLLYNGTLLNKANMPIIPLINHDLILVEGKGYDCQAVFYNSDGSITIDLMNEMEEDKFRRYWNLPTTAQF